MDKLFNPLQGQRGFDLAYRQAFEMATQQLARNADLDGLCRKTGARLVEGGRKTITLDYLGQACLIRLAGAEVALAGGESLSPRDCLIVLHYLNTASDSPLSGRLITFKELPEGVVYYPTFAKRAIKPLLDSFVCQPERLISVSRALGGERAGLGDISIKLSALPRVPLTLVLWPGDEELAPEGNILFDSSITGYLPVEDITVLCEAVAWRLVKLARG